MIDVRGGYYINPLTNDRIPLHEAIKRGLVKGKMRGKDGDEQRGIVAIDGKTVGLDRHPSLEDILNGRSVNGSSAAKIAQRIDSQQTHAAGSDRSPDKGVFDPTTGKELTIQEAVDRGLLRLDELCVEDGKGGKKDLVKATADGHVSPVTAKVIVKSLEPHALSSVLEKNLINPATGKLLSTAIERGDIDPEMVFYQDRPSHTIVSMDAALRGGKWNGQTGQVCDYRTQQDVSVKDAIASGLVDPAIDHVKLGAEVSALRLADSCGILQVIGVKDVQTNRECTVEDAIRDGILDLTRAEYVDKATG